VFASTPHPARPGGGVEGALRGADGAKRARAATARQPDPRGQRLDNLVKVPAATERLLILPPFVLFFLGGLSDSIFELLKSAF